MISETAESIKEARAMSAPVLPWMLRPSAPQLSRKPRPPVPTPSGKLKPSPLQPLGMQRPGEPPWLIHSTRDMPRPSNTWRNKSSKRKAKVRLTSSLPVKMPYKPALIDLRGHTGSFLSPVDGTSTHVPPIHLITRSPPLSNCLLQQLLLPQCLSMLPGPRGNTPPQTQWTTHACWWGPHPRQPQKDPPAPNGKRSHLGTRYSSRATQKCSAGDTSLAREARKEYFKKHSPNFTMDGMHVICQRSSGVCPRVLSY